MKLWLAIALISLQAAQIVCVYAMRRLYQRLGKRMLAEIETRDRLIGALFGTVKAYRAAMEAEGLSPDIATHQPTHLDA